jgi:CubicO group peptidase (beta-lactamase class C family)
MKSKKFIGTILPGFLAILVLLPATGQENHGDFRTAKEHGLMVGFPPPAEKSVTRANALFGAPHNRFSYLNMRMFYPTAGILPAETPSAIVRNIDNEIDNLAVAKPEENGIDVNKSVNMKTYLKETYTDARDKVVFEAYDNGMDSDHPHQMMSVTKSFAGLFGLMAVEAGYTSESELVSKSIPELETSTAFGDATFGQVLDMTNSMDFSEDYADPNSGIQHYGVVLGLMEPQKGKTYAGSIYEYLPTLPIDPAHPHGEVFHYQTPKTDVVNWVTNRVSEASFQDNLYNYLWSKLGTDGETYVLLDKNATLFAGGGLNATPNDLARFAMMLLNDGKYNNQRIVSPNVIKKLSDGGSTKAFADGPNNTGIMEVEPWSYRAQWWVRHEPGKQAFTAIGIHGQWIYIDIERDIAIIKQSSQPDSSTDYQSTYDINGFDAIIEYLTK